MPLERKRLRRFSSRLVLALTAALVVVIRAGAAETRPATPCSRASQPAIRSMLTLSLVFDHRLVDGLHRALAELTVGRSGFPYEFRHAAIC